MSAIDDYMQLVGKGSHLRRDGLGEASPLRLIKAMGYFPESMLWKPR